MGNLCTSASYEVYDPAAPATLPGDADDRANLAGTTTLHLPGVPQQMSIHVLCSRN